MQRRYPSVESMALILVARRGEEHWLEQQAKEVPALYAAREANQPDELRGLHH